MSTSWSFSGIWAAGIVTLGLDGSARPTARLVIMPGLTHYDILSCPAIAEVVTPLLEAPMPNGQ